MSKIDKIGHVTNEEVLKIEAAKNQKYLNYRTHNEERRLRELNTQRSDNFLPRPAAFREPTPARIFSRSRQS